MSGATVRRATVEDAPALYRAWQSLRAHNAGLDDRIRHLPVSDGEFALALREILGRKSSQTFVAEEEGALAGFITGAVEENQPDRLPERHVTIGYLFVEAAARRRGTGRRLFEAVRAWAAEQEGVSHVEMTVLAGDAAAEAFWRRLGFTPFIQRLWAPLPAAVVDA
ncbi:MAG: GNAT family N-acetyltransferase [Dehalococcoidia bacterium]|nr:GNAT family N-acetyltransferase [Dehalococcoidia bacterium]